MALWPFRAVLLPNAEASKKRLGSPPPPLEASEKISPVVIEEGELKEAFSKVIAPRGIMIFTLLDIGFVSAAIKVKDCTKLHNLKAYSCPRLLSGSQKLAKTTHDGNGTM